MTDHPSPLSALRARLDALAPWNPEHWRHEVFHGVTHEVTFSVGSDPNDPSERFDLFEGDYPEPCEFVAHAPADLRWCLSEIERLQAEVASLRGRHTGYREGVTEALPYRDREMWRRGRQGLCCGCGHSPHVEGCPVDGCACEG